MLHWLACLWGLVPQFYDSLRKDHADLEAAAWVKYELDSNSCTLCLPNATDPALRLACDSDCLTSCELTTLTELRGWEPGYTENQESWVCRAQRLGWISADLGRHGQLWVFAFVEAVCMVCGGSQYVIQPSNTSEYLILALAVLSGCLLIALVQGVICGIVTTGDPYTIMFRQVAAPASRATHALAITPPATPPPVPPTSSAARRILPAALTLLSRPLGGAEHGRPRVYDGGHEGGASPTRRRALVLQADALAAEAARLQLARFATLAQD